MNDIKNIAIYCGSSGHAVARYGTIAQKIGTFVANRGSGMVYGGGDVGLMGLAAHAALDHDGKVIGVITEHISAREIKNPNLTKLHIVGSMHERKKMMFDLADAFIILPGGLGTFDEVFEILTWRQIGLHNKPIIFYSENNFWEPTVALFNHLVDEGFALEENKDLFSLAASADELEAALMAPLPKQMDLTDKWLID